VPGDGGGEATTGAPGGGRRAWQALLKVAVSLGLLVLLLSRVDRGEMAAAVGRADLRLVLLCIPLYVLGQGLSTWRWQFLLTAEGIPVPFGRLLVLYLEGMFFSLFLPTGIGGDVVRGFRIWHLTGAGEGALASILVERLTGFAAMIGIAVAATAAVLATGGLPDPLIALFVGAVAAALASATVLITSPTAFRHAERLAGGRAASKLFHSVRRFCEAVQRYRGHGRAVWAALGISLVFQTLLMFLWYLVARALHLPVPFGRFLVFIPIINVITMLPISVGGLGLREWGTVVLFGTVGVEPAEAFTLSLLMFTVVVVTSLPGGVIFLWGGHAAKARPSAVTAK
jgi:hypothetical protein